MERHFKVREMTQALKNCNPESDLVIRFADMTFVIIGMNYKPDRNKKTDPFTIYVVPKNHKEK
jgi:hypothetical protein